jgi:MFS family permease
LTGAQSYGVFLAYYLSANTFPGASYLDYAFIGGLSICQALVVSPIATITTRKYGTRTTLLIGVFFETISFIGASFAKQIWQLFLSQGICFGWGMGFLFVGSVGVLPQWFSKRRGVANGIGTAGSGLGGMMYSLATNAMIRNLGLAWAFRILAILAFSVNSTCALLLRDRNQAIGATQAAFDRKLFRRCQFWLVLGWGIFSVLGYICLLFSLPNYATSVGLTAQQGAIIGALLNLGQGLGRPLVGYFSDTAGRINMAGFMTFFCGLICYVIWIFSKSYGVLIFFAILVGTVSGTFWTMISPVAAEVVGLVELPSALSITWLSLVIPTTFAEAIALALKRKTGDVYLNAQAFTASMYMGATLCMWLLRGWKIGELERESQSGRAKSKNGSNEVQRSVTPAETPSSPARKIPSFPRRMVMWKRV